MKSKLLKGLITLSLSISVIAGGTFISSKTIAANASSKIIATAKVTASSLNVREKESTSSKIIGSVKNGQKLDVLKINSKWTQIKFNNKVGYVYNDYISTTKIVQATESNKNNYIAKVTASSLNFRKSPTTKEANIITSIPKNSKVEVISTSNGWAKIKYNNKIGYVSCDYIVYDKSTSENKVNNKTLVDNLKVAKTTDQLVTVQATGNTAVIKYFYKNNNGNWKEEFSTKGHVGYNGISSNKREGDGHTPEGVYTFGTSFGTHKNIDTKFKYHKLDNNDWWCADPSSSKFNTFQHRNGSNNNWSTKGGEHLIDYPTAYEYALSINYNTGNKTPNKGSAIFIHCDKGGSTAGCVAVPKDKMQKLLKELKPTAKIVISSINGIKSY